MAYLKPSSLSRRDWFRYSDRKEHDPRSHGMISTNSFSHLSLHEPNELGWEQEEWCINAALIPLESNLNEEEADLRAVDSIGLHNMDFQPWWRDANEFDFGDVRHFDGVLAWPWIYHRVHRISNRLLIEPRSDFTLYHALDKREFPDHDDGIEYFHPLEGSVALRTWVEKVAFYNPVPFADVQKDYLRDYLAARKASLLIAIVADRFANAPTIDELDVENIQQESIDEGAWITTAACEVTSGSRSSYATGRSSLYWNVIVRGYDRPKRYRSAWYHRDERRESAADEQPAPTFIVDHEGRRCEANDKLCPAYLYFLPKVLDLYFSTAGYAAGFHMRTWGGASSPYGNIDVGINSRELLNASMSDIARLPIQEQMHWASHSVLPDGEICWAMFETRMQQNPPKLPGVVELVTSAFNGVVDAVHSRFGVWLAQRVVDLPIGSGRLSVGPIRGELSEVAELAVPLYAWVIETLQISQLKLLLKNQSVTFDKSARQLALVRSMLADVVGIPASEARAIIGPLDALNELRSKAAHIAKPDYAAVLARLGLSSMPVTPRRYWDAFVDAIVDALLQIAEKTRLAS